MASLFDLPARSTRDKDKELATKATQKPKATPKTAKVAEGNSLLEKIASAVSLVRRVLGQYEDKYIVIRTTEELETYITRCVENNLASIDTETTGLNPLLDKIAGVCLYTPGQKAAYVPINHVNYITLERIEGQLNEQQVGEQLKRLVDAKTRTIWFNAKFDTRFISNHMGVAFKPYWDAYIAARLLNENEIDSRLKALHLKYCAQPGEDEAFSFDSLFDGIPFTMVPIQTAYLYAARDGEVTYELYKFQEPFLTPGTQECRSQELEGPANVFRNIEMPLIPVVARMEDCGIAFDTDWANKLATRYEKELVEKREAFEQECLKLEREITQYKIAERGKNRLDDPINISSPKQISILLYDILKLESPDNEKPRGTGEDILNKINHPVCKLILDYREVEKLLSTYVLKMPKIVNPNTGRIHASFNQIGADTGRFSSSDPNMQNIPSHNKDIRKMFRASPGYVLLSSDYSAQEPRLTAHMSQDAKMIQAYKEGKDLYAEIAAITHNISSDECKEFRPDGTRNPEGKARRNEAKAIVLGVCYGKSVGSIGTDLGITQAKAQAIYDKIMKSFPGLKQFMVDSEEMARDKGYVTTVWGRKRRLPNMQLPPYEFKLSKPQEQFDPLFDEPINDVQHTLDDTKVRQYTVKLSRAYGSQKRAIIQQALKEGIVIKDNGGLIAEATRQCVNSRIQGSAADQTKLAMLLVGNDEELNRLGFRLLLPVHDELIGECPREHAQVVAERFSKLMIEAARDLAVPSKCDVEVTEAWYGDVIEFDSDILN